MPIETSPLGNPQFCKHITARARAPSVWHVLFNDLEGGLACAPLCLNPFGKESTATALEKYMSWFGVDRSLIDSTDLNC